MTILNKIKINIYTISVVIFIIYMTFTVIQRYYDVKGAIAYTAVSFISIILYPKIIIRDKIILFWLIYSFILTINYLSGDQYYDYKSTVSEIIQLFSIIIITMVFIQKKEYYKYYIIVALVAIAIVVVLSITSINQLSINPNLLREKGIDTIKTGQEKYKMWVGSYSMVHGIVPLIPMFVYIIRIKNIDKKIKLISFISLVVILLFVFYSNATTPLLLSIYGLLLTLIIKKEKSAIRNIMVIGIISSLSIITIVIYGNSLKILALEYILDLLIPGGSNYRKVYSMIYYGSVTNRTNLYVDSLMTFINNPIVGSNSLIGIGEHSFFIDRMAALGLIGFIPLVTLIILFNRYIYNILSHTKNYYIICVLLYTMMWLLKNVISYEILLYAMTILPGFCIYIETHLHKKTQNGKNIYN